MVSKRNFLKGASVGSALFLAGCKGPREGLMEIGSTLESSFQVLASRGFGAQSYAAMYGPRPNEKFPLRSVNLTKIDKKYLRKQVDYATSYPVGTIIVETNKFYLYLVQKDGKAMRYGVGLGRAGYEWSGNARVGWKKKWPKWTPPNEMIARQPELRKYSAENGGMPPGPSNPLGARAIYIFKNGRDTLYRLHGTTENWSIGKAMSSGCVRMLNHDIIDLYERVSTGTRIIVR